MSEETYGQPRLSDEEREFIRSFGSENFIMRSHRQHVTFSTAAPFN